MSATLFRRLDRYPPILCRLLAKDGPYGAPLTDRQIAQASGLSLYDVHFLSEKPDWEGVDLQMLRAFTSACGVSFDDPVAMKRVTVYLRGKKRGGRRVPPTFRYLRKSPEWKTVFRPLAKKWLEGQ